MLARMGTGRDAIRHYFAVPKFDGIDVDRIFAYWFDRDIKSQENSEDVSGAGDFAGDFAGDYVATYTATYIPTCIPT